MHLAEVHGREVDLESALITKRLQADVTLHALLAGGGRHEGDAQVVSELLLQLRVDAFAGVDRKRAGGGSPALPFALRVSAFSSSAPASGV